MRITLLTIRTLGDIQPFVALAVRLMQDGHSVKLVARPDFAGLQVGPREAIRVLNNWRPGEQRHSTLSHLASRRNFIKSSRPYAAE